ncbi:MAG TPA: replicative DNA helicase, partial [Spirochaetota bacterium]|nr:replicative DNA helicase [Spirochaetota bacterium]
AEAACLSSILLSKDALLKVIEILQVEDFYIDAHRMIYEAIRELEIKAIPIDLITIKQRLIDKKQFEKAGGDPALVNIYRTVSTAANAEFYANRVKELSLRRKLIETCTTIAEKSYDTTLDTKILLDDAEKDIFLITQRRITSDFESLASVLKQTLEDIGHMYETKRPVTGIASGFTDLDAMLTGFHESELIIIAARPSMGKTALALNIANHVALREKQPTLFFSLEMPATQLATRILCIESMIDMQHVRTGQISSEQLRKLIDVSGRLEKSPMFIDDTPGLSIFELRAKARRFAQKQKVGLIVVDYLQLIVSNNRLERHQQIAEISNALKQLARELSVPVIALSQLSRAVESRTDQKPQLSDLRESGAIEQDADVVLFIYREEKVKKETERIGIADIIVAKQRNGPTGTIELRFWDKYMKFGNVEKFRED